MAPADAPDALTLISARAAVAALGAEAYTRLRQTRQLEVVLVRNGIEYYLQSIVAEIAAHLPRGTPCCFIYQP